MNKKAHQTVAPAKLIDLIIFACIDLLALTAAILLAVLIRLYILPVLWPYYATVEPPPGATLNLWWLPLVAIIFLAYEGLYFNRLPYWREFEKIITALSLAYLIIFALVYLLRIHEEVSRTAIVISFLVAMLTVPSLRYLTRSYLNRFKFWRRGIIISGTGPTGISAARAVINEPYLGYEVIGFLDDNFSGSSVAVNYSQSKPLLGKTADCENIAAETNADIVIITASSKEKGETIVKLANHLHTRVKSLVLIPDLVGIPVIGVEADYFFNEQLISLRIRNNLARPEKLLLKRAFDIVAGTIIVIFLLPLMAVIAIAIKINDPGSSIFRQERVGKNGKTFTCLKFRTMFVDAEDISQELINNDHKIKNEWEQNFKLREDPRVTKVGKFLRAASLDELPQLINVLKGDMSLVGPRPRPLYELEQQSETVLFQAGLDVRPGLTGLWQVSGRSELDFENRIFLDSWYVRNWSFWLDISILLRTFLVLFRKSGAY